MAKSEKGFLQTKFEVFTADSSEETKQNTLALLHEERKKKVFFMIFILFTGVLGVTSFFIFSNKAQEAKYSKTEIDLTKELNSELRDEALELNFSSDFIMSYDSALFDNESLGANNQTSDNLISYQPTIEPTKELQIAFQNEITISDSDDFTKNENDSSSCLTPIIHSLKIKREEELDINQHLLLSNIVNNKEVSSRFRLGVAYQYLYSSSSSQGEINFATPDNQEQNASSQNIENYDFHLHTLQLSVFYDLSSLWFLQSGLNLNVLSLNSPSTSNNLVGLGLPFQFGFQHNLSQKWSLSFKAGASYDRYTFNQGSITADFSTLSTLLSSSVNYKISDKTSVFIAPQWNRLIWKTDGLMFLMNRNNLLGLQLGVFWEL